ncbi:MAG: adenylate/guanylate cyclase domain-containing protein, partial [Thermoleophilaceae bacterium]
MQETERAAPYTQQERRLVTVLFADFVGFTTLAEELDPEILQETVSQIFEDLAEEALAYDGTIEKFIGDAIFVVFGAPVAHEDDPQRALRCAIGMHRVFADHGARLRKERGVELGLRIGIHTGLVVAGNVRSVAEYGVMGDTVNTASRLQAAAAPGETYVTDETFRLTRRQFAFREVGPTRLRG